MCAPSFHTLADTGSAAYHPAIDGGRLFVRRPQGVDVYDAHGSTGCVASTCSPLYRLFADFPAAVSVTGGQAFTTAADQLLVFDATGTLNCSGTPRTCSPWWTATLTQPSRGDAPIVTGDRVFVNTIGGSTGAIEAFGRFPDDRCVGVPARGPTVFTTAPNSTYAHARAIATGNMLVVSSNTDPIPELPSAGKSALTFFDLNHALNCGPLGTSCLPIATIDLGPISLYDRVMLPAAGQGLIVVPREIGPFAVIGLP